MLDDVAYFTYAFIFFFAIIIAIFWLMEDYDKISWTKWGSAKNALAGILLIFGIFGLIYLFMGDEGSKIASTALFNIILFIFIIFVVGVSLSAAFELYPVRVEAV